MLYAYLLFYKKGNNVFASKICDRKRAEWGLKFSKMGLGPIRSPIQSMQGNLEVGLGRIVQTGPISEAS